MLFLIHCLDAPGKDALRDSLKELHRSYIGQHQARIFVGGPLLDEGDQRRIGSVIMVQTASRAEAEQLIENEPYRLNGVFDRITIHAFECVIHQPHLVSQE